MPRTQQNQHRTMDIPEDGFSWKRENLDMAVLEDQKINRGRRRFFGGMASAYAKKFSGRYSHRIIRGGVGHNLPQEAPQAFVEAVIGAAES